MLDNNNNSTKPTLLVYHFKYSSILYHFRIILCWIILWPWNLGYGSLKVIALHWVRAPGCRSRATAENRSPRSTNWDIIHVLVLLRCRRKSTEHNTNGHGSICYQNVLNFTPEMCEKHKPKTWVSERHKPRFRVWQNERVSPRPRFFQNPGFNP